MIDLGTLFTELGIVSGNTASTDQYEFYNGVLWNDDDITYNQYAFFKHLGKTRYEFFKEYGGEYNFYKNVSDPRIYDFKTFYQYGGEYFSTEAAVWLLITGYWRDIGIWDDTAVWYDLGVENDGEPVEHNEEPVVFNP